MTVKKKRNRKKAFDSIPAKILAMLTESDAPMTIDDISQAGGYTTNQCWYAVGKMKREGSITSIRDGSINVYGITGRTYTREHGDDVPNVPMHIRAMEQQKRVICAWAGI
jgi:DNA-binding Lrp family transcriptional regulator